MNYFADNLKFLRLAKGLKGADMLAFCGIERTRWSNYENGKSRPHLEDFIRIAKLFDVKETELLHHNLAAGPPAVPGTGGNAEMMQKLISCMEEKEVLLRENVALKSGTTAYSYSKTATQLNEPPKPSKK